MRTVLSFSMLTLQNRLIRAAGLGAALMFGGTALVLSWDWLKVIAPPVFIRGIWPSGFWRHFSRATSLL